MARDLGVTQSWGGRLQICTGTRDVNRRHDMGTRRNSGAEGEIFGRRLVILATGAKFGQEA